MSNEKQTETAADREATLLPCPFCGGEPSMYWDGLHSVNETITCVTCEEAGPIRLSLWGDPHEIVAAWNKRAATNAD